MESVKVALRIRPLVQSELDLGCRSCLDKNPSIPQVSVNNGQMLFTYDYVFDKLEGQNQVYEDAVHGLINSLFKGYNVTILAYGQTGSGKTYTMGTNYNGTGEAGVIPRAIYEIFDTISNDEKNNYEVSVSFLELYNETLYDLLTKKPREMSVVDVREYNNDVCIPELTEIKVQNPKETLLKLQEASSVRVTGATKMNAHSSRSHAIFTVNIKIIPKDGSGNMMRSKFHLVDLAGSERPKKTGADGDRFKEGVSINMGLLVLGNVISQLGDGNGYINYRDSKLTRLLKDSLGGNSVTLMIACVSPADYNQEETVCTLRYADRAKKIKNKPVVNQDPRSTEIYSLRKEIEQLRLKIINSSSESVCPPEHQSLHLLLNDALKRCSELSVTLEEALNRNMDMYERAVMAEQMNEKLKEKLLQLGKLSDSVIQNPSETLDPDFMTEIKSKIEELQVEHQRGEKELQNLDKQRSIKIDYGVDHAAHPLTPNRERFILSQARMNKEIIELNHDLIWKEELIAKMCESAIPLSAMKADSENSISELKKQLEELQAEKEELLKQSKITSLHTNSAVAKLAEQRRVRLKEVEDKCAALNHKVLEQERIIKLKEKTDQKIQLLTSQVQEMKRNKVRLINEMKAESERYRKLCTNKDREMYKLRSQNMKKQTEMARMEQKYKLEQNVLKRKLEAAAAANKRIMEIMQLRKAVKEKRTRLSVVEHLQEQINEELQMLVSVCYAQNSLDTLILDRAALAEELQCAKDGLAAASDDEKGPFEARIQQIQEDLDLRSTQISHLQQNILETNQGSDLKIPSWDSLHAMADAKSLLTFLMEKVIAYTKELQEKTFECSEVKEQLDKKITLVTNLKKQVSDLTNDNAKSLSQLEKEYEEKIYILLSKLRANHEGTELDPDVQKASELIQRTEFSKIVSLVKENERLKAEINTNMSKPFNLKRRSVNGVNKCKCLNGVSKNICECNTSPKISPEASTSNQQSPAGDVEEVLSQTFSIETAGLSEEAKRPRLSEFCRDFRGRINYFSDKQ